MANSVTRHMKNMTRTALGSSPISCRGIGHLVRRYVPPHSMFIYLTNGKDMISQDKNMHGSMFVPIVAGSDKTTVSVATGSQEYHPVYASLGNITNIARRAHGSGVVPIAFLPIPKGSL
jgi:Plavaka transposase